MLKLEIEMPLNQPLTGWEQVPIRECGEKLVSLSTLDPSIVITEYQYLQSIGKTIPADIPSELYLRKGAAERLHLAAKLLKKKMGIDHSLMINTAYRTPAEQEVIFHRVVERLIKENPRLSKAELLSIASRFASPNGSKTESPSPHLTGGAVDVSVICGLERVWMAPPGTNIYSDNSCIGYYEDAACEPELTYKRNRRSLFESMTEAGFTVNPQERWDYHFGNQIWAFTHKTHAIYGLAELNS